MADSPTYVQRIIDRLTTELDDCEPDLIRFYALLVLTEGVNTTLEHVHDAWAIWRDQTRPDHPSIVLFDKLDKRTQELDRPYQEAIVRVAQWWWDGAGEGAR
ncbi:DUF7701 domain-containing protein [Amycolatopsis thermophila]|uniref:DUF7701 domain-containing protein n=1 Tax=Amycolatopsis thermophila TaxID=206084 RepID=A0ABU0EP36_9PSEU|nr:hypothetical protein [Amycolatopsis thermophila]MDQ0376567.1 hypothetical protein [Amycolatopsis thermophila]